MFSPVFCFKRERETERAHHVIINLFQDQFKWLPERDFKGISQQNFWFVSVLVFIPECIDLKTHFTLI